MQNNWQLQRPWHGWFARVWPDWCWKGLWGQSVCCYTVTQFIKGQELHDKNHLVCGLWMGKPVPGPCSLLQGPNAPAPSRKPPPPPQSFLWQGPPCLVAAHTEGPSKPRRSVTSHPSSSRTPPREILHPFHSGGPLSHSDSWLAWKLHEGFGLSMQDSKVSHRCKRLSSVGVYIHMRTLTYHHTQYHENFSYTLPSRGSLYQGITDRQQEGINKIYETLHLFWQCLRFLILE